MYKEHLTKVQNNLIGGIAGGGLAFWAAKKYGNVSNMYALAGLAIVGVIVGANVQSSMKAKQSQPTSGTVTPPAGKPAGK